MSAAGGGGELPRRLLATCDDLDKPRAARRGAPRVLETDPTKATLELSLTDHLGVHLPVIDIDGINVEVRPSSTPGNFHLLIDKPMSTEHLFGILDALAAAGVVEQRYVDASRAQGASAIRTKPRQITREDEGPYGEVPRFHIDPNIGF